MKLFRHATPAVVQDLACVVAVGRFDGVHLGHQRVLMRLIEEASIRRLRAAVILRGRARRVAVLTRLREQLTLLAQARVDIVLIAGSDVRSDVELAVAYGACLLVTGKEGARGELAPRASAAPLTVAVVPAVEINGVRVAASAIAATLSEGDIGAVEQRLGHHHRISGRVVHGHHRGAPLGIPTANIRVRGVVLPPDGVYAVRAIVDGRELPAVTNIGFNPTFGNAARSVETHLLDFSGDLYGQRLAIDLVARLRGERRFPSVRELLAQIGDDIAVARGFFAGHDR
jgi:riboflavin kinase/FMN adenylyltransferase